MDWSGMILQHYAQATFYCFFTDTSCMGPLNVGSRVVANARLVQAGWKVTKH